MTDQLALAELPDISPVEFRPIQYLGNKWRLLDVIEELVGDVARSKGAVYDVFSGSGVVARRLAQMRPVVAADVQEYSRVLASALLNPAVVADDVVDRVVADTNASLGRRLEAAYGALCQYESEALAAARFGQVDELCTLIEGASLLRQEVERAVTDVELGALMADASTSLEPGPQNVMSRYYGGLYFSYLQAAELDAIATTVRAFDGTLRTTCIAALISTASEIVSTVGNQFAQPLRPRDKAGTPKGVALRTAARLRTVSALDVFTDWLGRYSKLDPVGTNHLAIRGDYLEVLSNAPTDVAAVYADPPYTRDHYSRFYHVLETLAVGDEPAVSEMTAGRRRKLGRALYREGRHQSPFCIKSQVLPAFRKLFRTAAAHVAPLIVSYSPYVNGTVARPHPRLVTVEEITAVASEFYSEVRVTSGGDIAHSKLNRDELSRQVAHDAEVFIVARH